MLERTGWVISGPNGAGAILNIHPNTLSSLMNLLLLDARDLDQAIELMSKHPGVRVGPFEIRPADEECNAMIAARGAARTGGSS